MLVGMCLLWTGGGWDGDMSQWSVEVVGELSFIYRLLLSTQVLHLLTVLIPLVHF
jgi:hypothetical protein